jgi:hypothetical protein
MVAYRAESSMASLLREHLARGGDDARALLRQIFQAEADLKPDLAANTLTVRLHHLTQATHDQAVENLLEALNADLSRYQAHPGLQTRLSLISSRSGGLNVSAEQNRIEMPLAYLSVKLSAVSARYKVQMEIGQPANSQIHTLYGAGEFASLTDWGLPSENG